MPPPAAERSPWPLEVSTVLLVLLAMAMSGAVVVERLVPAGHIGEFLGHLSGPPALVIFVVVIRLFGGAKTRRGRAKVMLATALFSVTTNCGRVVTKQQAHVTLQDAGAVTPTNRSTGRTRLYFAATSPVPTQPGMKA